MSQPRWEHQFVWTIVCQHQTEKKVIVIYILIETGNTKWNTASLLIADKKWTYLGEDRRHGIVWSQNSRLKWSIHFLGIRVTSRVAVNTFKAHSHPPVPSFEAPSNPGQSRNCQRKLRLPAEEQEQLAGLSRDGGRARSTSDHAEAYPFTHAETEGHRALSFPQPAARFLRGSVSDQW